MKRFIYSCIGAAAACLVLTGCSRNKAADSKDDPASVAMAWLAVVDKGDYAKSWSGTSQYFKGVVNKGQLVQQLSSVRKPMGEMISRILSSTTPAASLPGAPDGEYVIMVFNTSFTNKKSGIETLTVIKEGEWKVAGYYIK
jgi:hypothetical protein